jgi:chemotaxis protein CheX
MTIALAAVLDTAAAGPLRVSLKKAIGQGEPLLLDGDAVERVGAACLQVIAAGQVAATGADLPFRIERASPALVEMATLAGLGALTA